VARLARVAQQVSVEQEDLAPQEELPELLS
jgi:hypothetical protein